LRPCGCGASASRPRRRTRRSARPQRYRRCGRPPQSQPMWRSAISQLWPRICVETRSLNTARRSSMSCATGATAREWLEAGVLAGHVPYPEGIELVLRAHRELVRTRMLETDLGAPLGDAFTVAPYADAYRSLIALIEGFIAEIERWTAELHRREQLELGAEMPPPWHRSGAVAAHPQACARPGAAGLRDVPEGGRRHQGAPAALTVGDGNRYLRSLERSGLPNRQGEAPRRVIHIAWSRATRGFRAARD
jgi:hypothetical protein